MFATLTSWENLLLAYHEASRGKRRHPQVAAFEHRLEDRLTALRRDLTARTYRPGAYSSFFIHEPKRRLISAAPFRDRVVHHALVQVIEPPFERSFIADTYANRRGKGTHRALDRCQRLARQYPYVLQLDLRQFFPSIDHAILRGILGAKISDPGVLWLIDRIPFLGFVVYPDRRKLKRRKGIAYRRRLATLVEDWRAGRLSRDQLDASVESWESHASYGNTAGLRKSILRSVAYPLRA